jgi:hypothetical protein
MKMPGNFFKVSGNPMGFPKFGRLPHHPRKILQRAQKSRL